MKISFPIAPLLGLLLGGGGGGGGLAVAAAAEVAFSADGQVSAVPARTLESAGNEELPRVLVLVWTAPTQFSLRAILRSTLPELTAVPAVSLEVRFAVGQDAAIEPHLVTETLLHNDLARLTNMTEDGSIPWRGGCKLWHSLVWAVLHRPGADVVFKMDSDAIVDWRRALPLWTNAAIGTSTPSASQLRDGRLYLGRVCPHPQCPNMPLADGCSAGLVEGLSAGIASWVVRDSRPTLPRVAEALSVHEEEDVALCQLTQAYELATGQQINRRGLIRPRFNRRDPWAHPFKNDADYMRCYLERNAGCLSPDGHFVLPGVVTAADSGQPSSRSFGDESAPLLEGPEVAGPAGNRVARVLSSANAAGLPAIPADMDLYVWRVPAELHERHAQFERVMRANSGSGWAVYDDGSLAGDTSGVGGRQVLLVGYNSTRTAQRRDRQRNRHEQRQTASPGSV